MTMTVKPKRYAEGTAVDASKTREEIDKLLQRHGATQRRTDLDFRTGRSAIVFRIQDRMIRLDLVANIQGLPDPNLGEAAQQKGVEIPQGWWQWSVERRRLWVLAKREQRDREVWRRLLLVLKAKLELIADKMSSIEQEFLANILLPDGSTVAQALHQPLADAYATGKMPPILPAGQP
jgi:hypothetical protein